MALSYVGPSFSPVGATVNFRITVYNNWTRLDIGGSDSTPIALTPTIVVIATCKPDYDWFVVLHNSAISMASGATWQGEFAFIMPDYPKVVIAAVVSAAVGRPSLHLENWAIIRGTAGLTSGDVNAILANLTQTALSDDQIKVITNSVLDGLGSLSFTMPGIGDIGVPTIGVPGVSLALPPIGEVAPPDVQLAVAKLKEIAKIDLTKLPSKPGNLPDIFMDFAFARAAGSPTGSVWAAMTFPKAFAEPPTVIATVEYREGWFDPQTMTPPTVSVEDKTLEQFRQAFTDVKFSPPQMTGSFPTKDEIKAEMDAKLKDLKLDATGLATAVRNQADKALKGKLGDWKVGPFSLNKFRDIIIAALIAVVIIAAVLTGPATFIALVVIIGLVAVGIVKLIYDVAGKLQGATNAISNAQAKMADAVQKYTNDVSAQVSKYAYDLSNLNLAAMNAFAGVHTKQAEAALNNAVNLLYGMSDLPQMKLPVCAVRNVSTTGCEILIPKGATAHVFIIGKVRNPLESFLPRVTAQLSQLRR